MNYAEDLAVYTLIMLPTRTIEKIEDNLVFSKTAKVLSHGNVQGL